MAREIDLGQVVGSQGPQGNNATIQVGQVTTGEPGSEAKVTNSGTEVNAILDFVIPRGDKGETEVSEDWLTKEEADGAYLSKKGTAANQVLMTDSSSTFQTINLIGKDLTTYKPRCIAMFESFEAVKSSDYKSGYVILIQEDNYVG